MGVTRDGGAKIAGTIRMGSLFKPIIKYIDISTTSQNIFKTARTERTDKHDLLTGELNMLHECNPVIMPHVMTWDKFIMKHH